MLVKRKEDKGKNRTQSEKKGGGGGGPGKGDWRFLYKKVKDSVRLVSGKGRKGRLFVKTAGFGLERGNWSYLARIYEG